MLAFMRKPLDIAIAALPAAPDLARASAPGCAISASSGSFRPIRSTPMAATSGNSSPFSPSASRRRRPIADFVGIAPADLRAFLARRRADGVEGRSLMRALAVLRSLARYLERDGAGRASAFSAIRAPRLARSLPKPLGVADAKAMTHTRNPRRRGARSLDPGARRGGSGACSTAPACASPRLCRSAGEDAPVGAGRERDHPRQGPQDPLGAGDRAGAARKSKIISSSAPMR